MSAVLTSTSVTSLKGKFFWKASPPFKRYFPAGPSSSEMIARPRDTWFHIIFCRRYQRRHTWLLEIESSTNFVTKLWPHFSWSTHKWGTISQFFDSPFGILHLWDRKHQRGFQGQFLWHWKFGYFYVKSFLQNLAANDAPPPICGKPIPQGQALYGCRDCGQDDTCVMCSDCFNVSAHKNHNYR